MRTRLVEVDDATAVMNIYNPEVIESSISFDLVPRTLAEQEAWIARHLDTHPCIVAVNEDDEVGEVGARGEGRHEGRIGGERTQADPGVDRCASP